MPAGANRRRCESIGINEWGTDGLMNLRQKWRLIIYVVKGRGEGQVSWQHPSVKALMRERGDLLRLT